MPACTNLPLPRGVAGAVPAAVAAAVLALAAAVAGCVAPGAGTDRGGHPSPRLHHLLDLEDSRAALRELEPFLRDPDAAVRSRAALAVARKGGDGAPPLLRLAARDPEERVRAAALLGMALVEVPDLAAEALAALRRPGAGAAESAEAAAAAVRLSGEDCWRGAAMAEVFRHPSAGVRRAAFRALVATARGWKEKPPEPPAWLVDALGAAAGEPEVAASAALVLSALPPATVPPAAIDRLAAGLAAEADADVRGAFALAYGRLSPAPLPALERALVAEPLPRVRVMVVRGAAAPGPHADAAGPLLARVLAADPDHGVRTAAAEGLAARPGRAAQHVDALVRAAGEDPSRMVRVAALAALHAAGDEGGAAAVRRAATSTDPWIRAAAPGPLLPAEDLGGLLRDPVARVRIAAAGEAGERGRAGVAFLLDALRDPDPVVAAVAADALGAVGVVEAAGALHGALRRFPAPEVAPDVGADLRASALKALGAVAPADPATGHAARAHLLDPDPAVVAAARGVLGDAAPAEPPPSPRLLPFPAAEEILVDDAAAPRLHVETTRGTFVVALSPSVAPIHVARLVARVRDGGYDGTVWHRIVPNFVIQGGDPRGDGSGNGGAPVRQEFSGLPYLRGTFGVPRSDAPDSGGCQWFFCHGSTPHLDRRYTVVGRMVEGFEVLEALDLGDRIVRARLR